jgi:hypothetical protein
MHCREEILYGWGTAKTNLSWFVMDEGFETMQMASL